MCALVLFSLVLMGLLPGGFLEIREIRQVPWGAPSRPTADAECGIGIAYTPLIYGGRSTVDGEFPWLLALFYHEQNYKFRCAGSLISNRHVVTAAHCVNGINKNNLLAVFGKRSINNWNANSTSRHIENIMVHPEFVKISDADVAVIVIDEPVKFNDLIRPVCLWNDPIDLTPLIGKNGTIVGWGEDETGYNLDEARRINIPIVDHGTCLWSNIQFFSLTSNRTFCAGKRDGRVPCRGDSGSGFLINQGGRWRLRGVVSASLTVSDDSSTSCDGSHYAVFSDIAKFRTWLDSILKEQSNTTHIKDLSISEQKCNEYNKAIKAEGAKCNYEDIALSGAPAVSGEFPFLAVISDVDYKLWLKCGGTLISDKFVMTAASCGILDPSREKELRVRLGITQSNDVGVEFRVLRWFKHPNSDSIADIALVELNDTVKFTKWIRPACLWNRNEIEQSTAIATRFKESDSKLIFDQFNLISNSRCNGYHIYNKYKLRNYEIDGTYRTAILDSILCAMASGRPFCDRLDAGHPLFITREESRQCKFYIIGIIKLERGCNPTFPDVYSRVSSFVKWIEKIVWHSESIDNE